MEEITKEDIRGWFYYEGGSLIPKGLLLWVHDGYILFPKILDNGSPYLLIRGDYRPLDSLIWLWHNGYVPTNPLIHLNKNVLDCRIENLRESTRSYYEPSKVANVVKGVTVASDGLWNINIYHNGKVYNLGRRSDFIEACAMRYAVEQCLGWSECDGSSSAFDFIRGWIEQDKFNGGNQNE